MRVEGERRREKEEVCEHAREIASHLEQALAALAACRVAELVVVDDVVEERVREYEGERRAYPEG